MDRNGHVITAHPLSIVPCLEKLSEIFSGSGTVFLEMTKGEPFCPLLAVLPRMEGKKALVGGDVDEASLPCEGREEQCLVSDPAEILAYSLWKKEKGITGDSVNYSLLRYRLLENLSRAEGETGVWQAVSDALASESDLLFFEPAGRLAETGRRSMPRGEKGRMSSDACAQRSLAAEVLCSGEPRILSASAPDRPLFSESSRFSAICDLAVLAAWPISSPGGETLSVLLLGAKKADFFDSPHRRSFLREVSEWTALALSRIRHVRELENLSVRDSLTGLLNRRGLSVAFSSFHANIKRRKTLGILGVIDLDDFKPVNDTWGHAAGDVLLEEVAVRLRKLLRESDLVGRTGGDEFVFVSEVSDSKGLSRLTERISRGFSRSFVLPDGQEVSIALSCGLVRFSQSPIELGELLLNADCALYRAKRNKSSLVKFVEYRETGESGEGGESCDLSGGES